MDLTVLKGGRLIGKEIAFVDLKVRSGHEIWQFRSGSSDPAVQIWQFRSGSSDLAVQIRQNQIWQFNFNFTISLFSLTLSTPLFCPSQTESNAAAWGMSESD